MEQSEMDDNVNLENLGEDVDDDISLTKEELLSKLKKANAEAANRRVSNKQMAADNARKLAEYDEWKKSQMTEAERLKQERDELAELNRTLTMEKAQSKIALKVGLDEDLMDLIKGDTEEEMLRNAKKLAEKFGVKSGQQTPKGGDLFAGKRGKPVGVDAEADAASAFNNMMRRTSTEI